MAGLHLPDGLTWRELVVVVAATSIGLTLALFAATAVLPLGPLLTETKIGALLTAAGVVVAIVLARLRRIGRFAHPS
jgi:Na+/H+ antiporter NhaA